MKKWLSLLLFTSSLFGMDDYEAQFDVVPPSPPPFYPFSVSGQYIDVSKTQFYSTDVEGQHLTYRQYDTGISYTHPFSEYWGLIFGAGWIGTDVDWDQNPDFTESNFNYINLSIGAFTKACSRWTWNGTFGMFFDLEEFSLADYTLYQGVIMGQYEWFPCLQFDVGCILEAGLNKTKVWPILGFIYNPTNWLHFNCVYPIDIEATIDVMRCLSIGGGLQFLRNRHRVQEDEPNSRCIFQYQTWGWAGEINYKPTKFFRIQGFAGSTLRGDLKITNSNDKHGRHFKFNSSFLAGVNAVLSF